MTQRAAIILAAGQGTRMKSPLPKVLHRVGGRTLVDGAIDAAQAAGCERVVVVVGAHSPQVGEHIRKRLGPDATAVQDPPLGTGHAVLAARDALAGFVGDVVITTGDAPLLTGAVIAPMFAAREAGADVVVMAFAGEPADAYGRMVMGQGDRLDRIVESKEATAAELGLPTRNAGVYALDAALLFSLLGEVGNANAKGEYYLTDIVAVAKGRGLDVRAVQVDPAAAIGVDSQDILAVAEGHFQRARRNELMAAGVTMPAPDTVYLSFDTCIAAGAMVEPFVVFGPGVSVEAGAVIRAFSHLEGAQVRAGATVGPYARLRPGADVGEQAHIGNFVEIKNVTLGKGAKANHLSYLGDGTVGAGANIGAGVIFCNYDGFFKYQTHVGAGAFIGSDTALVAPVTVGDGAFTGTGSVITKDVAPGALAIARGQQVEKPGWAENFRTVMQARKDKSK